MSMTRHKIYSDVPAQGPLQAVPGLRAKPTELGMAQPDLAGPVVGPVSPTRHSMTHPINIV
jgi:hypothetical protein